MYTNAFRGVGGVIGAVLGTYFVVQASKGILRIPIGGKFLEWCGKNSLYIYCFHAIDRFIGPFIKKIVGSVFLLQSTKGALLFTIIRIGMIVGFVFLFLQLKAFVRNYETIRKRA